MPKKSPTVNGGSMSDISFLLLTFFLLTSSINTDLGLSRKLPPPIPPGADIPQVHERNVFTVLVNANDQLRVRNQNGDISQLRKQVYEFLKNPNNDPNMSEKSMRMIEGLGEVEMSKGVISLQNDRGTSYEAYIKVQNELAAAVTDIRDDLSRERFGVKFTDLKDNDKREAIQKAVPVPISEAEPKNIGGQK